MKSERSATLVGEIAVGKIESLRIFRGSRMIYVRAFFPGAGGELRPAAGGLRLPIAHLEAFLRILAQEAQKS